MKNGKKKIKVNAGACALGLPSPDGSAVDLSLHRRGIWREHGRG